MLEITNNKRHPVQLVVKSLLAPREFTVLNVPGIGAKKNKVLIEDQRHTDYIDRVEKMGWIKTRYIKETDNSELKKGE